MNRSVLARQMFAKGGAAFPDLSGDGKITQKDILMGRGVPMQEGGDPQMAQLQAQADAMGISLQELLRMLSGNTPPVPMPQVSSPPNAASRGFEMMPRPGEENIDPRFYAMEDARSRNPDMENYIDESGELFYDPASGAASRRQMFDEAAAIAAKYQQPVGMAMGGDPAMAQGVGGMMPPDMPPPPAMPEGQGMAKQVMDPQVLEGVLSEAQNQITDLDEAEDYETVINSIRGDDAPIEERYEELASIVGEEDARQTPESVLTLVQPAMVMGAVDQGIGGLAQGAMAEPVQGAMAQGIMSTVEQPAMEAGGTPPVNFKDGGLVRRGDNQPVLKFANAGVVPGGETLADFQRMLGVKVTSPQNLTEASLRAGTIPAYEPTYDERVLSAAKGAEARYAAAGLGTAAERAAELEEQKNLTQAQMLFDIAQTALTYAGPMQGERPGMSAAERLAMAASSTKLPQTIGARAQTLAEQKKAADKEERALKLAAVQRGETQVDTEIAAEKALELAKAKKKDKDFKPMNIVIPGGITVPFNGNSREEMEAARAYINKWNEDNPQKVKAGKVAKMFNVGTETTKTGDAGTKKTYTVTKDIMFKGKKVPAGSEITVSPIEANSITDFAISTKPYAAPAAPSLQNVKFPDGSIQTFTTGTNEIANAIKPKKDGGLGGVLAGKVSVGEDGVINLYIPNKNGVGGKTKAFKENTKEFWDAIGAGALYQGAYTPENPKLQVFRKDGEIKTVPVGSKDYYELPGKGWNPGAIVSETKPETGTSDVRTTAPVKIGEITIPGGTAVTLGNQQIADVLKTQPGAFEPVAEKDRNKPVSPFDSGSSGKALNHFVTAKVPGTDILALDAYADGADDPILEAQFAAFTKVTTDATGRAQKNALPPFVIDKIKTRVLAGGKSPVPLNTLGLTRAERTRLLPSQDVPLIDPVTNKVNIERALSDGTFIIDVGADLTQATGFTSTVDRIAIALASQFGKLGIGPGYAGKESLLTTSADVQLKELARRTIATFRPDTRIFKLDVEGLKSLVSGFEPGGLTTDQGALATLKKTRDSLAMSYSVALDELQMHDEVAGSITAKEYGVARRAEKDLRMLIAEYTAAIVAFETSLRPGGAVSAVSTSSNITPTATSTLPRVSQYPTGP